jgi:hypothetical protein
MTCDVDESGQGMVKKQINPKASCSASPPVSLSHLQQTTKVTDPLH